MENQVAQYDPAKLMEMVRDRIRATYVSMIPDEQWTSMIKKEVDAFFQVRDGGYQQRYFSSFGQVVQEELAKAAREKVSAIILELGEDMWTENGMKPNEEIKKMCIENSGAIMASLISSAFQGAIQQMRGHL